MRPSLDRAPRPVFPTEVFEHIIDMVAEMWNRHDGNELEGRVHGLHACTLVAWSWVPRSRIHLYRHIRLESDLRTTQFLNSLTLSPALGEYVRFLIISASDDTKESPCGWIFRAISILPPLLPHPHELVLRHLPVLRPVCIAVLSRFRTIESLELTRIRRHSLQEIMHLINRFPRLRLLHVWSCQWEVPGRCYKGKAHNLSTLDLRYISQKPLMEWAIASDSTCALTIFRADYDVLGSAMDRVLQTCCSTLRELHLDSTWTEVPLLTNHLALVRLAFYGVSEHIIRVVARLPLFAPSSLVGILFDSSTFIGEQGLMETPESAVDFALSDSKFPHLTSVQFIELSDELIENPHTFFQRVLPNSYVRGLLWYQHCHEGPPTRIAPVGAPQYLGLPLEWELE